MGNTINNMRYTACKRTVLIFILAMACIVLLPQLASAATYYVDKNHPAASDVNPGTEAQPLLTIDRAMVIVQPGDHVYIKGGTSENDPRAIYDRSGKHGLPIQRPGTAGNIITVEAYPGDTVVLQGNTAVEGTYGVNLTHISYYTIRGLIFDGFRRAGADDVNAPKNDILIEKCTFRNCPYYGIRVGRITNFTMRDCSIYNCYEAGVWIEYSTNVTFERDEIYSIPGASDGFVTNYVDNAVYINCSAHENEDGFDVTNNGAMINCRAYNNTHVGIKLWRRSGDNYAPKVTTLINNIIYNNGQDGIRVSDGAGMRLYNSVIYQNAENGIYYPATTAVSQPVQSYIIDNVISENGYGSDMSGYNSIYVRSTSINIVDANHNCFYHNQAGNVGLHSDLANITSDPFFLSPSIGMFQLQATSPVVDAGIAVAEVTQAYSTYLGKSDAEDYDGVKRLAGTNWDIGAYERVDLAGNTPPVFTTVPPEPPACTNVNEGQAMTLSFQAMDPGGHRLIFFLTGGDIAAGMTINPDTGVFSWTPDYGQGGNTADSAHIYNVVVGVTDQYYAQPPAETTIRIVAHNVNRPPVYDGLVNYTLVQGRLWMFGLPVTDSDGDAITYTIQNAPAHLVLGASTGVVSWTPAAGEVGSHSLQFKFSDGLEEMDQTITFEVLPQAPYQTPADENSIFYVDGANGNDTNNGQTEETAWRTIGKAAGSLTAGQMVLIRGGTYHEGYFTPRAGTPGNPIIYKAYPGESVIMDGDSTRNYAFTASSYLVWDGITFNNYIHPLHASGTADNWTIVNCIFENVSDVAIYAWTKDGLRIENSEFRNIDNQGITEGGTNIHFYNVKMSNIADRGINFYSAASDNVTIENCEFTGCGRWALLLSGTNAFVYGSRIHDNTQIGVDLAAKYNFFVNSCVWNTAFYSSDGVNLRFPAQSKSWIFNSVIEGSAQYGISIVAGAVEMKNTIVCGNAARDIVVGGASLDEDYNIFGSFAPIGAHSFSIDPLFMDADNGDFSLKAGSLAINAGIDVGLPYSGSAPDIGAYEYVSPQADVVYGDVSGDAEISAYDAALTAQASVGIISLTPEQAKNADVSGDGEVSAYDAALIAQRAVGLIDKFPVE